MTGKFFPVADYLSYEEAVLLYRAFTENDIPALVKTCGPATFPFGEGRYFQLLVPKNLLENAAEIAEKLKADFAFERAKTHCPTCGSEAVFPAKTLPFWQKIYYAGTEVLRCANCRRRFPS